MNNDLPYRPCVGVALVNRQGEVFIGHRKRKRNGETLDERSWQMPQGGVDEGEEPLEAARRELWEETNVRSVELDRRASGVAELRSARGGARPLGRALSRPVAEMVPVPLPRPGHRKSTCSFRPTASTGRNSTLGAGSVSNDCPTWSCRSSGRCTRPSRRPSRRWRGPPGVGAETSGRANPTSRIRSWKGGIGIFFGRLSN